MIDGLDNKDANYDHYVNNLFKNKDLIYEYLDGFTAKNQIYMENCFYVLKVVSEKNPDFLYSHWEFFVEHIGSKNEYHKTAAIIIISNLTSIDKQKKFEIIFDQFFDILKSEKTMAPIYLLKHTSRIINFKPNLENKITNVLLNIDNIHSGKNLELVKSAVIESFSEFFSKSKNKDKIVNFVEKQLDSKSPKARKTTKNFLKKYVEN